MPRKRIDASTASLAGGRAQAMRDPARAARIDPVTPAVGATRVVVQQARALTLGPLPEEPLTVAKQCLLDWVGVALAGASEPLTQMLVDEFAGGDFGEATLVGCNRQASAPVAALVNGAAAHALDYDDMHFTMKGHATAPVAAAVLALGERLDASGAEVLAALVAGIEAECRVGMLVNPSHYQLGWHATGTLGTFGAAAGCARLLGLDERASLHAFGIAGTQAAGLKAVFGTMSKPLQAGKAAMNGLLAATLAARGFTSRPDIIEAPQAFGATHSEAIADADLLAGVSKTYLIRDTLFKYHAACYWIHAAIEGAVALRERHRLRPAAIVEVEVAVSRNALEAANILEPSTGLEAKFSVRAVTAMALLGDDTADPHSYSDARMSDADLVSLRDRVRVIAAADGAPGAATVRIRTCASEELAASVDTGKPAVDVVRQGERVAAKFGLLATPVLGRRDAGALREAGERMEDLGFVRELTALTIAGPTRRCDRASL